MVRLTLPVLTELVAHLSNLALRLQKMQGLAEGRGSFFIFSHYGFPFNNFFFRKSSFLADLNQMSSLFSYGFQYIFNKNYKEKKRFLHLPLKNEKNMKKQQINCFCDFLFLWLHYGKLARFGLSLFHPTSQFLVAFFLCCSAPPLYKLKKIGFLLIHLILVPSGIVAILLFLHPCRQQHILLFRFSGYDLICKHFNDLLFMYMFEDYKEDWSQFLKGLFTI